MTLTATSLTPTTPIGLYAAFWGGMIETMAANAAACQRMAKANAALWGVTLTPYWAPAPKPSAPKPAPAAAPKAEAPKPAPAVAPKAEAPKPAPADDLTRLKGVGPKLAAHLNDKGITTFAQIAGWSAEEVATYDETLDGIKGKVSRDDWVAQAKALIADGKA